VIPSAKDQANLKKGDYNLQITDKNNCLNNWTIPVKEPDSIRITTKAFDIKCSGQGNGRIEASVTGGAGNYSYFWTNKNTVNPITSNTDVITNIRVEDYYLTVTDQNSCTNNSVAHVSAPDPLDITVNKKDISCFGKVDGYISLTVNGGRSPFTYEWNNGATEAELKNLNESVYTAKITDWGGCVGNVAVTIKEPDSLKVSFSKQDVLCSNYASGKIELAPSGGTAPYYYMWSSGFRGRVAENLKAGDYLAVVRDSRNCPYDLTVNITQPEGVTISKHVEKPFCPDTEDGLISIAAAGGTGSLSYQWNNGSTATEIQNLSAGKYILTITDGNNCETYDTTVLIPIKSGCVDIPNAFSPNGDAYNETWDIRAGDPQKPESTVRELYPNAVIQVFNRWGILVFKSGPGYTEPWDGTWNGKPLPVDSYYYILDLRNGGKALTGNVTIVR
jgi:gliding motility-associated-like protein